MPGVALAQAQSCRIPLQRVPLIAERPADEVAKPGRVTGYTLALSWSPQYCRSNADPDSEQCSGRNGRFGFILHGLWPEGEGRDALNWCGGRTMIAPEVVRAQFCTMPSTRLIAHEWAKHGSCAAHDPGDYFAASRKLFAAIRLPDMDALSRRPLTAGDFKRRLAALNPAIPLAAIVVKNDRDDGWLDEVRICLNRALFPEVCPRDRDRGAPDRAALRIWRGPR